METKKYTKEDNYLKAKKKVETIKGFYRHLAVYVIVNCFITVFIIIRKGESFIDAIWDLQTFFTWVPWGIGVLIHGLVVFEVFKFLLGKKWEERKIKELMEKESNEMEEYK